MLCRGLRTTMGHRNGQCQPYEGAVWAISWSGRQPICRRRALRRPLRPRVPHLPGLPPPAQCRSASPGRRRTRRLAVHPAASGCWSGCVGGAARRMTVSVHPASETTGYLTGAGGDPSRRCSSTVIAPRTARVICCRNGSRRDGKDLRLAVRYPAVATSDRKRMSWRYQSKTSSDCCIFINQRGSYSRTKTCY
jgi:hypothetical protein